MSLKSILCSIFAVLSSYGLIFGTMILFGIETILGIVGIVLLLVIPGIFLRKAIANAEGFIDGLLAKLVAPAAIVIGCGFIILSLLMGWIPW